LDIALGSKNDKGEYIRKQSLSYWASGKAAEERNRKLTNRYQENESNRQQRNADIKAEAEKKKAEADAI
jgi:hypothetical protein